MTTPLPDDAETIDLILLQADVDDDTPERLAAFAESMMAAGALDCTQSAIQMKKGRLGTRVEVLTTPERGDEFAARLLRETTTIGVRRIEVRRTALARRFEFVEVAGQRVRAKIAMWNGEPLRGKAEFEHVRHVAEATGRTLADVQREADARIAELLARR